MMDLQHGSHLMVRTENLSNEKHSIYVGVSDENQYVITFDDSSSFTYTPPYIQRLEDFLESFDTYTTFEYNDDVQNYRGYEIINRALVQTTSSDESIQFLSSKNFAEWCVTGEPLKENKWKWNVCHVKASRTGYTHHGIYLGTFEGLGFVIHYSGFAKAFDKGSVEVTTLDEFRGEAKDIYIVDYPENEKGYGKFEIIDRAFSKLGEDEYNLFTNNCEHFACWCITGESKSTQVERVRSVTISSLAILDSLGVISVSPPLLHTLGASKTDIGLSVAHKLLNPMGGGIIGGTVILADFLFTKLLKK